MSVFEFDTNQGLDSAPSDLVEDQEADLGSEDDLHGDVEDVPDVESILSEMDLENEKDRTVSVHSKEIGGSTMFFFLIPSDQVSEISPSGKDPTHALSRNVGEDGLLLKHLCAVGE